ncbi:AAA family ATPase [Ignavibacteriales bacterium]
MMDLFSGIYGQEPVKEILAGFLTNHKIPQALLFSGPSGTGKDFLAIRFANLLNTRLENFSEVQFTDSIQEPVVKFICPLPVGKNESSDDGPYDKLPQGDIELIQEEFRKKEKNPYYHVRIPKANDIKISSIRSLQRYMSLSSDSNGYRVILISEAHLMNEPAQNSLLKNLEEPPKGFVFILTTSEPAMLRETIRSRCWPLEFRPLLPEDIAHILTNNFGIEPYESEILGKICGGSVSRALYLKEKNLLEKQASIISFLRNSLSGKFRSAQAELKDILSENDSDLFRLFFNLVLYWFEDYKRYLAGIKDGLFYAEHIDTFEKFSVKYKALDPTRAISSIEKILYYIENNNVNMQIASYNIMFLLASLIQEEIRSEKIFVS